MSAQPTQQVVLKADGDLIAARALIESVVSSVVGGRAFTGSFRSGVRDVHRAIFNRGQHTVTLAVGDIGTMIAAGLEAVQPSLAQRFRTTRQVDLVTRDIGSAAATAARAADTIRLLAWLLVLVAVAASAAAIWLATDRRRVVVRVVVRLGVGAAIGGAVVIVALDVGRSLLTGQVAGLANRDAVHAVWDAFLGDLRTAVWILAGAGAIVAAAAASLIRPVAIDEPLRRAGRWLRTEPTRPDLFRAVDALNRVSR